MFAYWCDEALPLYGFHMAIKPVKIFFFQYQLMHLDAEFDWESDFVIKRDLNPWFDQFTDIQIQNFVLIGPIEAPGTQRVKIGVSARLPKCFFAK